MRLKVVYTVHERNPDGSYGQSTTHVARTASGVSRPAGAEQGSSSKSNKDSSETATTFLKSCLALICYTRPDLIPDVNTDYAISVLDIAESAAGNGRVFEGQGMMGWILAEQNSGTTCIAGKLHKGPPLHHDINNVDPSLEDGDVLEVVLELKPVSWLPLHARRICLLTRHASFNESSIFNMPFGHFISPYLTSLHLLLWSPVNHSASRFLAKTSSPLCLPRQKPQRHKHNLHRRHPKLQLQHLHKA